MKKSLSLMLGLFCVAGFAAQNVKLPELYFNPPPRKIKVNKNAKLIFAENGKINFGIVVPEEAGGPARFAAEELALFLGKALNAKIPVAKQRDAKWKHAIILGDCALSRKAGLDVTNLHRDGFLMKTVGNDIYIAGQDDKASDTKKITHSNHYWGVEPCVHQRGTLFGAYDFLERFAGVRFYLPIDLGIIVPKLTKLEVPHVDIFDRPDCAVRTTTAFGQMYAFPGPWIDKGVTPISYSHLAHLRYRGGTRSIPNCHGLQYLSYWKRFGKTHPEYFVKDIKGKRQIDPPGFICLSSGIVNEIIEDAKSALRGESPKKRGMYWVHPKTGEPVYHLFPTTYNKDGFFNVHLMDAMQACFCDKCGGSKLKPGEEWTFNAKKVWQMTVDVANAVKKDKIPGWITQMGYNHYREVPDIDIPDNVIVQLAFNGPFQMNETDKMKYEYDLVKRWNKKLNGRKVWFWIYLDAVDEGGQDWCRFPGVSQNAPYTVAKYFQDQKGHFSGCMVEILARPKDWINLNTSMRVMWDNDLDINKYMDEFYTLMFGKAAPLLKSYFVEAEKIWVYKVRGESFETPLGPKPFKPSEYKIWNDFYPPKLIQKWVNIFDRAEAAVKNSPEHLKRVKFFRQYYLGPTLKYYKQYWANRSSTEILQTNVKTAETPVVVDGKLDDAAWKKAETNYLGRFRFGGETPIRATVKVLRDNKNLYVGFESIDPLHKHLATGVKPLPGQNVVSFATFEVMLNPSGDKENVYQILINPSGKSLTLKQPRSKEIKLKHQVAAVNNGTDRWSTELVIPFDQLPGFNNKVCYVNFAYHRALDGVKEKARLFTWSPYLQSQFYEPDRFGKMVFDGTKSINILSGYDFAGVKFGGRLIGNYWSFGTRYDGSKVTLDQKNFVTGGQSVCLEATTKEVGRAAARIQYYRVPKLEPGKKYRLSMYVKSEMEKGSFFDARVWTNKTNVIPSGRLQGKFPWMKIAGDFIAPPNGNAGIGIQLYGAGKVYVDHVVLQKID